MSVCVSEQPRVPRARRAARACGCCRLLRIFRSFVQMPAAPCRISRLPWRMRTRTRSARTHVAGLLDELEDQHLVVVQPLEPARDERAARESVSTCVRIGGKPTQPGVRRTRT